MPDTMIEEKSPKEINDHLLSSELRYRRLFESAKDGILILDAATGQIEDVNPFLIELLGYPRSEILGKRVWDIGFIKDIISSKENFQELKDKKYIRYEDHPLKTSKGEKIDVEFVSNVYQEGGRKVIQCNIRNITERKHIAEVFAAERERLAVTLRSIGEGVITTDVNGIIETMNVAAEYLCGWKLGEVQGKPLMSFFIIVDESTLRPHENPIEKTLKYGKATEPQGNTILIAKDGSERIIIFSVAPMIDSKNNTIGIVLVFRDITEKHKLLEAAQNLQRLESLGLLAAGIAHDFNNLMSGIFGYIDMANEVSTDDIVNGYLSKAANTIDRARDLTRRLLTFAKGGIPVKIVDHLTAFVKDAAQFALSGSNVSCRFDVPDDLWVCDFDKNQIGQVIDNIVINADQAMPTGGTIDLTAQNITLREKEHPLLPKGNYIRISITDHGTGIPKELIGKIFDPFFSTKKTGHGLGLSTCFSIIKKHGGCIDVDSEPGRYTTFNVYLPACSDSDVAVVEKISVTHNGNGMFLVMDDEEIMRDTIGSMLTSFGYSVVIRKNGSEAVDFVSSSIGADRKIAGIIFDLTVPGDKGGKATIEEIRKLTVTTPVFIVSGYADDPVMRHPAEYGFTASICKPFRKVDLSDMLNNYL